MHLIFILFLRLPAGLNVDPYWDFLMLFFPHQTPGSSKSYCAGPTVGTLFHLFIVKHASTKVGTALTMVTLQTIPHTLLKQGRYLHELLEEGFNIPSKIKSKHCSLLADGLHEALNCEVILYYLNSNTPVASYIDLRSV